MPERRGGGGSGSGRGEHGEHGEHGKHRNDQNEALYAVALLRIALELKRKPAPALEELIATIARRMRLDEPDFRAFLNRNLGSLVPVSTVASNGRLRPV
jgi:hypothetical protein